MLKFLFAIIFFLSIIMLNLFTTPPKQENTALYYGKKFEFSDTENRTQPTLSSQPKVTDHTKYIYLTFDDGPLNGSQNINAIAYKYRVPLSVMVVGEHVFMSKNQKRYFQDYIQNPFIEVGNHSYSHANNQYYSFYSKPKEVLSDFNKSTHLLALQNNFIRLPGRNVWAINNKIDNHYTETTEAVKLLSQNGYQVIGWDIEWHYNRKTKEPTCSGLEFFIQLKNHFELDKKLFTPNNIVVLLHDPMFRKDSTELENFIKLVQAQKEYVIAPLSRYPKLDLGIGKNTPPPEEAKRASRG